MAHKSKESNPVDPGNISDDWHFHSDEIDLTQEQIVELERRLEDHRRNPSDSKSWKELMEFCRDLDN